MAEVTFCGETLRVPDDIGIMPLMRFAREARFGLSYADVEGLAAMLDLLESCISKDDGEGDRESSWVRFNLLADEHKASGDALWALVQDVFKAVSDRPTSRPSDSSDGSTSDAPSSTDDSYLQVVREYEAKGRPDLAALAYTAHELGETG